MQKSDEVPTFSYTALAANEIRLLSPIDCDDGFTWKLQTVSLDASHLDFEALSYTWGPQDETYPIVCNDQILRVHHNLWTALPFLAQRMRGAPPRVIWVDAVCINQKDDEEKAVQIKLMNTLYRRAKRVHVWLGCGTPEVQAHMPRAIALLPEIIEETKRRDALGPSWKTVEVGPPLQNLDANVWKAILFLLRNPWYSRVWIVQEAALAADITFMSGADEIATELLKTAIEHDKLASWKATDSNGDPVKFTASLVDCSTVFWIRELVSERHISPLKLDTPGLMIRVTILITGNHGCFLPQDQILGMLGLFREDELAATGIVVEADTTSQTLYTQFTTYLYLNNDPNDARSWWDLFDYAFTFKQIQGLPSWVPDYHHHIKGTGQVLLLERIIDAVPRNLPYQASGTPTTVKVGSRPGSLLLQGRIVDEVVVVHPEIPKTPEVEVDESGEASMAWLSQLAQWEEDIGRKVLDDGENEIRDDDVAAFRRISEDTYWQTICMNYFTDAASGVAITKEGRRAFRTVMAEVRTLCDWSVEQVKRKAAGLEETTPVIDPAVIQQIGPGTQTQSLIAKMTRLTGRQLFNTANGYFGAVLRGVRPGDLVCVLNSATVPHVLRKVPGEGGDVYQAIGDAYVSDLMYVQVDGLGIEVRDIELV